MPVDTLCYQRDKSGSELSSELLPLLVKKKSAGKLSTTKFYNSQLKSFGQRRIYGNTHFNADNKNLAIFDNGSLEGSVCAVTASPFCHSRPRLNGDAGCLQTRESETGDAA